MKILLLGKRKENRWYEDLFKEELFRTPGIEVHPYGRGYTDWELDKGITFRDKLNSVGDIDVILTSLTWGTWFKDGFFDSDALKVSIVPDYYEGAFRIAKYVWHYGNFGYDVLFGYGTIILDYLKKTGAKGDKYYLPFGVDIHRHRKLDLEKTIDVMASYTVETHIPGIHGYRKWIQETVAEMPVRLWTEPVFYYDMVNKVNQSKIAINANVRYKFINPRVTEVMACGTLLFNDHNRDFDRFGYKHGEHLIFFYSMGDLKDKINYFLKHDKEREEIAENGMNFVRANFSNEKRIEALLDVVRKYL